VDVAVPAARAPVRGRFLVPASKSWVQRALVLAALADGETTLDLGLPAAGDDVERLGTALRALGRWSAHAGGGGSLGTSRESLTLDLGLGATGFRLATALATLRPAGARTLVRGRPALLSRPHRPLRRALGALGAHVVRRGSGAHRVVAGGVRGGEVAVGCAASSQHVSALLLIAPRLGGLAVTLVDRPVSRPYLDLTLRLLAAFGVDGRAEGLDAPRGRIAVPGTPPRGARLVAEPDASAAAAWWAAAALTGGEACVPGLSAATGQADVALLGVLERMGARVAPEPDGSARVVGTGARLSAPGDVDLTDAPDLVPLVGVLAATAEGRTRIHGVAHARGKESDRLAGTAAGLSRLGGRVEVRPDGLTLEGAALRGGRVDAAGDHRLALAFGVLGLVVPGVVVGGAQSVAKSQPGFWEELARAAHGRTAER
jgi:3-phosphoshikimate 1-carboxyvinyltransferase